MLFLFTSTLATLTLWGSIFPLPMVDIYPDQPLRTRAKAAFGAACMAQSVCNFLGEIPSVGCPWSMLPRHRDTRDTAGFSACTDLMVPFACKELLVWQSTEEILRPKPIAPPYEYSGYVLNFFDALDIESIVTMAFTVGINLGGTAQHHYERADNAREQQPSQEDSGDQSTGDGASANPTVTEESPADVVSSDSESAGSSKRRKKKGKKGSKGGKGKQGKKKGKKRAGNPAQAPADSSPEAGPSSSAEAPVASSPKVSSPVVSAPEVSPPAAGESSSHLTGRRPDKQQVGQKETADTGRQQKKKNRPSQTKRQRDAKRRAAALGLITETEPGESSRAPSATAAS